MLGSSPARDRGGGGDDAAAASASASEQPRPQPPLLPRAGGGEARGLVLACADLFHRGDLDGARRVADAVLAAADPRGEAGDRLAHHFARALLALRGGGKGGHGGGGGGGGGVVPSSAAYLAYIKIAPFLRFAHLTANQAILEAAAAAATDAGGAHRRVLHIVDLDAAHGVQWPPLLQAIADRADPAAGPPPEVRLTGAGTDRDVLLRTGDRLRAFSSSLNLPFRFHPLILPCTAELAADPTAALELHPDETLAVNCVLFLHKLGGDGELAAFLRWVKSMNPAVVTIAEREGVLGGDVDDDNVPDELPRRVAAAMDYYSSVFDALEATVPPASADRLAVEQEILSREIDAAVVAPGGGGSGGRARGFDAWAAFAASQARLLLRLHYPSEGYKADDDGGRGACFLRWQQRPLMSVSSWQPQP
uniref:Uncharacterized protein n=1 Tax=Oryza meridionalis TaxID=40149 RepID=A0A0E0CHA9_9ORYZ